MAGCFHNPHSMMACQIHKLGVQNLDVSHLLRVIQLLEEFLTEFVNDKLRGRRRESCRCFVGTDMCHCEDERDLPARCSQESALCTN